MTTKDGFSNAFRVRLFGVQFARVGVAFGVFAITAGCAAPPRTPPDPGDAAAILRDGRRLFARSLKQQGNEVGLARADAADDAASRENPP